MSVAERLAEVRARIVAAARRAGRDPASVQLIAVSKRHGVERIREAYEAGQRHFGENYVQELVEKHRTLAELSDLRWHFIGHLQRNKAKLLWQVGASLDTLDSQRLGEAIVGRAEGRRLPVSIQVNVSGEPQKSGLAPRDLPALIEWVRAQPTLRLEGLMTVPPASADPGAAAPHFARLAELAREHGVRELSMGMSADLEVAIAAGATRVRVGTAIFGPRPS